MCIQMARGIIGAQGGARTCSNDLEMESGLRHAVVDHRAQQHE